MLQDFDFCDDSTYARESRPSGLTALGDRVVFAAEDAAHGQELWTSDGTADGTVLIRDIRKAPTP
jgi:ELWxxDGT repeat protein